MKTKLLILLLFVASLLQAQIYVNQAATGANDGSSWTNAYTDLNTALTSISTTGNEVWIAAGRYTPHTTDNTVSFELPNVGTKLYGGFAGTEATLADRDLSLGNETILSGDLNNDDTGVSYFANNRTENSLHVVKILASSCVIDGLTISDGQATDNGEDRMGAAIYKLPTIPNIVVSNCTIKNNVNSLAGSIIANFSTSGGGKFVNIFNCIFDNNLARFGAGFHTESTQSSQATVKVYSCLFTNNTSADYPGDATHTAGFGLSASAFWVRARSTNSGIYSQYEPLIQNCTFANNHENGSASNTKSTIGVSHDAYGIINSSGRLANSIFYGNKDNSGNVVRAIHAITDSTYPNYAIRYSIDEYGFAGFANTNTVSTVDPLFRDVAANDFQLAAASPAVDTGSNAYLDAAMTEDVAGDARIFNTTVDMGAYENSCSTCVVNGPSPIVYVEANASGANDGTSWTDAYTDLATALNSITTTGKQVWITGGRYTPAASDRTISFNVANGMTTIYGGFAGTEVTLANRDLSLGNETILSGDLNNDDTGVSFTGNNRADNSLHVIKINADNVILDGITIADGHADASSGTDAVGAAILKGDTFIDFTIQYCVLKDNVNYTAGTLYATFLSNATLNILNSTFDNNLARYATGFYSLSQVATVYVNVYSSLFTNNTATDNGAIQGLSGSSFWVRARDNATIYAHYSVDVNNCTFANNTDNGTSTIAASGQPHSTIGISKSSMGDTGGSRVVNSIFHGNIVGSTAGVPHTRYAIGAVYDTYFDSGIPIRNSIDPDGFSNMSSQIGTLTADPLFVNAATNNFGLLATSPAVDSGNNVYLQASMTADVIANARVYNTTVDRGAYEYDGTSNTKELTIISSANGSALPSTGTLSGGVYQYNMGTSVDITATANAGYTFDHYNITDSSSAVTTSTSNPLTLVMNDDFQVEPVFVQIVQRTLTMTVSGNGTVSPSGTTTYNDGTTVALTATPAVGWLFDHWAGDASGNTNPLSVTMNVDKTIQAVFTQIQVTLNMTQYGSGATVSPAVGNTTFTYGDSVTISVSVNAGWELTNATVDGTTVALPYTFTITANTNVSITVAPIQKTLTTTVSGSGSVSPVGTNSYLLGATVTITATPVSGWQFDHWAGDASGNTNPLTVTMNTDKTIQAVFTQIQRTLTTTVSGTGTVTPSGTTTYNDGDSVTLTATAGTGYQFDHWQFSNGVSSTNNPYTFNMNDDYTIEAVFTPLQIVLSMAQYGSAAGGTVSPAIGNTTFNYGDSVTVTANVNAGWEIISATIDGVAVTLPYTFTITNAVAVEISLAQIQTILTVVISGNGTTGPYTVSGGPYNFTYGNSFVINAYPDAGYNFTRFDITDSSGVTTQNTSNPMSLTMTDDITVTAVFMTTAAVGQQDLNTFKIYPNPTRDVLNIRSDETIENVIIYNLNGQKLYQGNEANINVATFAKGVYIIQIEGARSKSIKRFIKK